MISLKPATLKHRLIISLLYSCGLRRGEIISLKCTDLNTRACYHPHPSRQMGQRPHASASSITPSTPERIRSFFSAKNLPLRRPNHTEIQPYLHRKYRLSCCEEEITLEVKQQFFCNLLQTIMSNFFEDVHFSVRRTC